MSYQMDFSRAMVGDRIPQGMKRKKKKKTVKFVDNDSSDDGDGGSPVSVEESLRSEQYIDVYEEGDYTEKPMTAEQLAQASEALKRLPNTIKPGRVIDVQSSNDSTTSFVFQKSQRLKRSHEEYMKKHKKQAAQKLTEFISKDSSKYPIPLSSISHIPLKPNLRTIDYMKLCSGELGHVICNHLYLYDGNVRDFYHVWAAIYNCINNNIIVTIPLKDIIAKIRMSSAVVHRIMFWVGDYTTNNNTLEITCKFNDMTPLQQESRDDEGDEDLINKPISGNDLLTVAQDRLKCKLLFTTTLILGMDGAELFSDDIEKKEGTLEFVKMEEFTIKE